MGATAPSLTVEDLLLPGTPDPVRERYLTLAERAHTTTFGLLEEDLIILDTETTGLSARTCDLIEIAATRISGREVVDTFQTFVRPSGPIPPEISALTSIRDVDVADAPDAREAVAALAEFSQGMPIVAHNASFDRTFIEHVRGGHEVSDTWIDSLTLSRIALPRLRSHRLADMAQAFGCPSVTHRAMADVEALSGIWRILLLALSDLPATLMGRLSTMHEDVEWSLRPLFAHLALAAAGAPFSLREERSRITSVVSAPRKADAAEIGPVRCGLVHDVDVDFSAGGVVSELYGSFEARPSQLEMAREVARALEDGHHVAIEAPTGVGKSMAYLLPAVRYAQEAGVTVGVATKTNALTDQLVSKELPALDAALPDGVRFMCLKGYDHYPCLRRVELSCARELPIDRVPQEGRSKHTIAQDMLSSLAVTLAFACQSPDGDLDALGIRWRNVPRDMLTTTHSECLRSRCPFFPNGCFVHGARRRAASADVVVTNHSLLLRDVEAEGAILPPIRHWIVDEAHSFEQEARRQWALELSAERANAAFQTLGSTSTGVLQSLLAQAAKLDGRALVAGLLTKAASKVSAASLSCGTFLQDVHALASLAGPSGGYDSQTLWIDENVRRSDEWAALERSGMQAAGDLQEATKALLEAQETLQEQSPQMASELADATRSLLEIESSLRLIVLEPTSDYVYSAELSVGRRARPMRERLVAEKLDVGADLAERWYPELSTVVYTSATITVADDFAHFEHAVGLDRIGDAEHTRQVLTSGYDFDSHMSVVVARDLPAPGSRAYLDALENLLFDVHVAMDGSCLTLFTNRREMENLAQRLRPRLAEAGLELACQDRSSSPARLRERFVADEQLSLFALKSFWEGVDAAGDTLRCVVIVKLPFASPNDPIVRERDAREARAWFRYSLPEAVLSVKQAAGRLIRSSTDTGVLVLADSRIATKRYGTTFLRSLPTERHQMMEARNVGSFLRLWRAARR